MSMIDDIRKDRERGTVGAWKRTKDSYEVADADGWYVCRSFSGPTNARRIARVPDMEAALLAADELADAVSEWGAKGRTKATAAALNKAYGNYRAATEGKA